MQVNADLCRAVECQSPEGKRFIVVVNFADTERDIHIRGPLDRTLRVPGMSAKVVQVP